MNKKAQSTLGLFIIPIVAFIFILLTATMLYIFNVVDGELSGGNIMVGAQNLSNDSANTFGQINSAFLNTADLIVILFVFGYVIGLILLAYFLRDENPALLFFVDIIIIILAYIISVYISNSYESVLSELPFADTIISNMNVSSNLVLNLPLVTIVTGAIVMIVSYAGIPKRQEEQIPGI